MIVLCMTLASDPLLAYVFGAFCHSSALVCRVVEQDIADILLDAWHSSAPEGADVNLSHHSACAKALIDAADQQELNDLEAAFVRVEAEYDEQTLGDVADRILIYAVQKGWGAACKVTLPFIAPTADEILQIFNVLDCHPRLHSTVCWLCSCV